MPMQNSSSPWHGLPLPHYLTLSLRPSPSRHHQQEKLQQCEQTSIKPLWVIQQCSRSPLLPRLSIRRLRAIKVWHKRETRASGAACGEAAGGSPPPGSKEDDAGSNASPAPRFTCTPLPSLTSGD